MISIRQASPHDPAAQRFVEELDAYHAALYPAESNHLDPVDELVKEHVYFVGAYEGDQMLGCGAVKVMSGGYGELKRMYVHPHARGQGIGRRLLNELENYLTAAGVPLARLETGIHQPEALALYRKCGYRERGPFGAYGPDPLSVFMEKSLMLSNVT